MGLCVTDLFTPFLCICIEKVESSYSEDSEVEDIGKGHGDLSYTVGAFVIIMSFLKIELALIRHTYTYKNTLIAYTCKCRKG